jgi:TDG/mug DNA glycosylase family protein
MNGRATLPDVIDDDLAVLFCGINPGLEAAATGHHFAGRGNRFWQVMHLAGFTPVRLAPDQGRTLLRHGYGLTTAVARPSARADQVAAAELLASAGAFERKVAGHTPRIVAFLGKSAWSVLTGRRNQLCAVANSMRTRPGIAQMK